MYERHFLMIMKIRDWLFEEWITRFRASQNDPLIDLVLVEH